MNRVMLIEDSSQMVSYISEYLNEQDYVVGVVTDFNNVIAEVKSFEPNLILLDINLPKFDGFFFLKQIKKNFDIPVIIISARSDESEQIRGLENGASDYITKPFSINILLAKIAIHIKTSNVSSSDTIEYRGLSVNTKTFKVSYNGSDVELTKNEIQILSCLIAGHGDYISRISLLEALWDDTNFIDDNTLTVNITRVRKRLSAIGLDDVIINKRGVGYALVIN